MSWLFGIRKDTPEPPNFSSFVPPADGGDGKDGKQGEASKASGKMEAYRFDSSALERAAKAAKDLESSSKYIIIIIIIIESRANSYKFRITLAYRSFCFK